jgi:tetratricopeptide (TPR) repeat protein
MARDLDKRRLQLAERLVEWGSLDSAHQLLQKVRPQDYKAKKEKAYSLADIHCRRREYTEALALVRRYLLGADPLERCRGLWISALCLEGMGDFAGASKQLQECLALVQLTPGDEEAKKPDLFNIHRELGHISYRQGRFKEAESWYLQAGKYCMSAEERCSYFACLGNVLVELGSARQGLRTFFRALSLSQEGLPRERFLPVWEAFCYALVRLGYRRLAREVRDTLKTHGVCRDLAFWVWPWQDLLASRRLRARVMRELQNI